MRRLTNDKSAPDLKGDSVDADKVVITSLCHCMNHSHHVCVEGEVN